MEMTHHVHAIVEIHAPMEAIWARVSDHEKTPSWIDEVRSVRVTREGQTPNGLGAIRVVEFRPAMWSTIQEEIVLFEPPRRFHYVLFEGMPGLNGHLGRVEITPQQSGACLVRWDVDFAFQTFHPFRLIVPSFVRQFEGVLQGGLNKLKAQLETAPTA